MSQTSPIVKQGWCFGNFCAEAPECGACQLAAMCEPSTKRSRSGDLNDEDKVVNKVSPMKYLMEALSGKFDENEEEIEGGTYHFFTDEYGNPVVAVAIYKDGRVELQSASGRIEKKSGFKSIDAVETALAGLGING